MLNFRERNKNRYLNLALGALVTLAAAVSGAQTPDTSAFLEACENQSGSMEEQQTMSAILANLNFESNSFGWPPTEMTCEQAAEKLKTQKNLVFRDHRGTFFPQLPLVSDLTPLLLLPHIEEVSIDVKGMPFAPILDGEGRPFVDLQPLAQMPNLKSLSVSANTIIGFTPALICGPATKAICAGKTP